MKLTLHAASDSSILRLVQAFRQAVAQGLLAEPSGASIDLGSQRLIVPSSFASRLIQEELAKQAPNGVLLPIF